MKFSIKTVDFLDHSINLLFQEYLKIEINNKKKKIRLQTKNVMKFKMKLKLNRSILALLNYFHEYNKFSAQNNCYLKEFLLNRITSVSKNDICKYFLLYLHIFENDTCKYFIW